MIASSQKNQAQDFAQDYVTFRIDHQLFGIPILRVRDIIAVDKITKIPLSAPEVAGSLNLRGRIVTAIDMRKRLRMPPREAQEVKKIMTVVVESRGDLYSLIIDQVGEVLSVDNLLYEQNPSTMENEWRDISNGIFRLKDEIMVILDVDKFLLLGPNEIK